MTCYVGQTYQGQYRCAHQQWAMIRNAVLTRVFPVHLPDLRKFSSKGGGKGIFNSPDQSQEDTKEKLEVQM